MFTRSKTPHHIQHLAPRVSVDLFKLQNVHHRLCETPTAVIRAKASTRDLLSFSPPSLSPSRLLSPQFATDKQSYVSIPVAHE